MRITDYIKQRFKIGTDIVREQRANAYFGGCELVQRNYAALIWYNICDILCDIAEDVEINFASTDAYIAAAFRQFFYQSGKITLQKLYDEGYVVIGYDGLKFWIMSTTEYRLQTKDDITTAAPLDENVSVYVMRSACYRSRGVSDRSLCRPFLDLLDDVLNATATATRKLGALVIASPKNLSSAPTQFVMTDEQKKKMEKEMAEDYGSLQRQSNIMLLPREMSWQIINLAGLDLRMQEKVRNAILAVVDRIKVPANQVAIIDANSSKSFANGSELREGDKSKYKSFRRLFENTFVQMGNDIGVKFTYRIQGEPLDEEVRTN